MKITVNRRERYYEGVRVEFVRRETDGSGEAILIAPTGERARVIAAFAGPGGARTMQPDEVFVRKIISGREEFPYFWAY